MLVCCCRVLLVLCALFWRGGRVFPFSFPFVLLCLPLSFLSSLVDACACAPLLCLYSQGYFCSPLTPAKKKPLWTGRFCVPRPPGCWSSSAACLRLPPPLLATAPAAWTCLPAGSGRWLLVRTAQRTRLHGACVTSSPGSASTTLWRVFSLVNTLSRTCSLPCLPPPVFFSSCPVCCGFFAALLGASLGSLDVCVVGEVFTRPG